MVILDSNILIYSHIPSFAQHQAVNRWLNGLLDDAVESVGIMWQVAASFIRITTNGRLFSSPYRIDYAVERLDDLFSHSAVTEVGPTRDHWDVYSRILNEQNLTGDDVMDARIAAVAFEHGASIATVDKGFKRFSDYAKIIDPITLQTK